MTSPGDRATRLNASKNEIRLLLLQPGPHSHADIRCLRKTVSLDDNPNFEALSYAWGDPAILKPILLDNEMFHVTVSAYTALKALRYEDKRRVLWIDAICINQTDPDEKSEQLKLMGSIYRRADSVLVWLGEESEEDEDAVSILKTMTTRVGADNMLKLGNEVQQRAKQVQNFLSRSWWERLWVVQEVALGRHVVFRQGPKELNYEELIAAYYSTQRHFGEQLQMYRYGVYSGNAYEFMDVFESVKMLNHTRKLCGADFGDDYRTAQIRKATMTWATVVNLLRNKKASVDKDRLYALYGLLPPTVAQQPGLEPSYSLTTEQTYANVTYSIIEATNSLMVLNFLNRKRSTESSLLPSWAPDWRLHSENRWEGNARVSRENLFNACQGAPFYIRRLTSDTIGVNGFFVDLVQRWRAVSLMPSASPMLDGCHHAWQEMWSNTDPENAMPKRYLDGTSAETAFRRTMVWDCNPNADEEDLVRLTQEEGIAMFRAHDRAVKVAYGDNWDVAGQSLSLADARRTNYMMNCAKGRAFFVTATGLIGMVQSNVEAGDHIFIVAGNSHPVVLRPSKLYADTWHAVSECYLHGFMDGEGVRNAKLCAKVEEMLYSDPAMQTLKGTERNPLWDDITERPEEPWKLILIE